MDSSFRARGVNKQGKFWSITVRGTLQIIRWGKVGTTGQTSERPRNNFTQACEEAQKLIKTKETAGYTVEILSDGAESDDDSLKRKAETQGSDGVGPKKSKSAGSVAEMATGLLPADKPACVYGLECFRKQPEHFEQFGHPGEHPKIPAHLIPSSSGGRVAVEQDESEQEPSTTCLQPPLSFCPVRFPPLCSLSLPSNTQEEVDEEEPDWAELIKNKSWDRIVVNVKVSTLTNPSPDLTLIGLQSMSRETHFLFGPIRNAS